MAVAENPPGLPGLVELAEVPVRDPGLRFVPVAAGGPLPCELPEVSVEIGEDRGGYRGPVVVGPAEDDRVEPLDPRDGVASPEGAQLDAESFPDPSDGRLVR